MIDRRRFLLALPGAAALLALRADPGQARSLHPSCPSHAGEPGRPGDHPDPRPGIDASNVLPDEALATFPGAVPVFAMVREIPQVVDGVQCRCGCAEIPDHYSLLSCFEGQGMAMYCQICQGQARMVHRLHGEGRTLDEIRDAVDARYL